MLGSIVPLLALALVHATVGGAVVDTRQINVQLTAASGTYSCPNLGISSPQNEYVIATGSPIALPAGSIAKSARIQSSELTAKWGTPSGPGGIDVYLVVKPLGAGNPKAINAAGMYLTAELPTKTNSLAPRSLALDDDIGSVLVPALVLACKANSLADPPVEVTIVSGHANFIVSYEYPASPTPAASPALPTSVPTSPLPTSTPTPHTSKDGAVIPGIARD